MRSEKYPDVHCYGIVITASCDIAQEKVNKLYYLIAADAKDWFSSPYSFKQVYSNQRKAVMNEFHTLVGKHDLNADVLANLSRDDFLKIIDVEIADAGIKTQLITQYDKMMKYCSPTLDSAAIKKIICAEKKQVSGFLKEISRGNIKHYYYLPKAAYLPSDRRDSGLIVDLQEIDYISIPDAHKIDDNGIDFLELHSQNEHTKFLKQKFWLENDSDFVDLEGTIDSPWREHLMQCFSHGFIRIGLDGATNDDFARLAASIGGTEQ